MKLRIGFSGTRFGMKDSQKVQLRALLNQIVKWHHFLGHDVEVHHGDCVGADEEFHHMSRELGVDNIVIHPPTVDEHRAFCDGDEMREPYPHLTRNAHIVRDVDVMLTAPPTDQEQIRGGTWSTTRLAREQQKLWYAVLPSGLLMKGEGKR